MGEGPFLNYFNQTALETNTPVTPDLSFPQEKSLGWPYWAVSVSVCVRVE